MQRRLQLAVVLSLLLLTWLGSGWFMLGRQHGAPRPAGSGLYGIKAEQTAVQPLGEPWRGQPASPLIRQPLPDSPPAEALPIAPSPTQQPLPERPEQPLYAYSCGAEPVKVRDPLDPANPYFGKYAAYDAWVYVQAWEAAQGQAMSYAAPDGQASGSWYSMAVDNAGWPVPLRFEREQYYSGERPASDCRVAISAYGFMGNSLEAAQQDDLLAVQAPHLPQVPLWLAQAAPLRALILPDGEVLTHGPLQPQDALAGHDRYYRFSADGKELGSAPQPYWWRLYWTDFDRLLEEHPGSFWHEANGQVTRYSAEEREPQESWSYRGERLRRRPPTAPPGSFEWLSSESLRGLYELQSGDRRFSRGARGA